MFFLLQFTLVAAAFLGPPLSSVVFPLIFFLCGGGVRVRVFFSVSSVACMCLLRMAEEPCSDTSKFSK